MTRCSAQDNRKRTFEVCMHYLMLSTILDMPTMTAANFVGCNPLQGRGIVQEMMCRRWGQESFRFLSTSCASQNARKSNQIERAIRLKSQEKRRKPNFLTSDGSEKSNVKERSYKSQRPPGHNDPSSPSRDRSGKNPREIRYQMSQELKHLLFKGHDSMSSLQMYEKAENRFETLTPFLRRNGLIYQYMIKHALKVRRGQRALQLFHQVRSVTLDHFLLKSSF